VLTDIKSKLNQLLWAVVGQKRRLYVVPLIAAGISALLLVVPLPAYASLWSLLAELVLWIAKLIGGLVITLIDILIQIVQYNDFINAPAVSKGWVIVRDVVNMFVIVLMLVIAFATTFRIEEYQYKKLLSRLLIMSVLVNFSKMLTGFFIDFAQVIMLTFVNGFKEAAAGNFVNGFKIQAMYDFAQNTDAAGKADSGDFLVAALLALISLTITLVVVGVYVVVFLLRIVFLWMLIILSPMAFVLSAFPGQAKKYSTEWWEYFGKYLTAGPILAFFLWLSLAVMQFDSSAFGTAFKAETKETAGVGTVASSGAVGASISAFGQSDVLLSFIINIILLLGGLWMTQKLGVAGGKLAGAALAKIQSAGASIAKAPFKPVGFLASRVWGTAKYNWNLATSKLMEGHEGKKVGILRKAAFAVLNPVAAARGWEARTEEIEKQAQEIAGAYGREVTEQFRTGGKLKMPYATFTERRHEDEFQKEYQNMTKEEFMETALNTENLGGLEGKRRRRAIVKSAASQGYLDDIMRLGHFANKYGKADGTVYDDETLDNFLYGYMGHDQESMRVMTTDLEHLGKGTHHWEYLGHAYFDPKSGAYHRGYNVKSKDEKGNDVLENTWQKEYSRQEIQKVGGRIRVQDAPHNELSIKGDMWKEGEEDEDGNVHHAGEFKINKAGTEAGQIAGFRWGHGEGGPTGFQQYIMSATSDASTLRDIHFAQGRMKEAMLSKEVDGKTGEVIVDSMEQLEKIQHLFDEIPNKILRFYAQLADINDLKEIEALSGFVVRVKDKETGQETSHIIGEPEHKPPIAAETAAKLARDKSIPGKDEKELAPRESAVADVISQMMLGQTNSLDAMAAALEGSKKFEDGTDFNKLAEQVVGAWSSKRQEFFEPNDLMGQFAGRGVMGKDMVDFVKEIKSAIVRGFLDAAMIKKHGISSDDTVKLIRNAVRSKIFPDPEKPNEARAGRQKIEFSEQELGQLQPQIDLTIRSFLPLAPSQSSP